MKTRSDGWHWVLGALVAVLPVCAVAEDAKPADCARLVAGLGGISGGHELRDARPVEVDGWCQLDGAMLRGMAEDVPNISARSARVRGTEQDGELRSLELEVGGLKVAPKIGDRGMDDRLRSFLRLQTADLVLSAAWDKEADLLAIRNLVLTLPGRNRLTLSGEIKGADLSAMTSLLGGSVTVLDLELVTDGRIARPVMQMTGERMLPEGAEPSGAVAVARKHMAEVVEAMPEAALDSEGKFALTAMVSGMPQTTGKLVLQMRSGDGISPARLALNGLRDDPLAPPALAKLFDGVTLMADWQPGAAP
jgi:hypothetical protein